MVEMINVWMEPWLRHAENSFIYSPIAHGEEDMKVVDLVNQDTNSWDWNLIREMLNIINQHEIAKPVFCKEKKRIVQSRSLIKRNICGEIDIPICSGDTGR
jgi:hypothetical protein